MRIKIFLVIVMLSLIYSVFLNTLLLSNTGQDLQIKVTEEIVHNSSKNEFRFTIQELDIINEMNRLKDNKSTANGEKILELQQNTEIII